LNSAKRVLPWLERLSSDRVPSRVIYREAHRSDRVLNSRVLSLLSHVYDALLRPQNLDTFPLRAYQFSGIATLAIQR
jgi:hypothetical protein